MKEFMKGKTAIVFYGNNGHDEEFSIVVFAPSDKVTPVVRERLTDVVPPKYTRLVFFTERDNMFDLSNVVDLNDFELSKSVINHVFNDDGIVDMTKNGLTLFSSF